MLLKRLTYDKLYVVYERHRRLALLYHMATPRTWKPSQLKVIIQDLMGKREPIYDNVAHCRAAMKWLFVAQDSTKVGGISAEYNLSWGWRLPFPEVSGYIIPTMLDFARQFCSGPDKKEVQYRALQIADWLLKIQQPDGSYCTGLHYDEQNRMDGSRPLADRVCSDRKPAAFETGQILWGLNEVYQETQEQPYLEAALKAADWLVRNQSPDGSWAIEHQGVPVSFSALTACNLAKFGKVSERKIYERAAIKNLNWCAGKQEDNGWFNACAHTLGSLPWTHGIAYAAQGFLGAGIILGKDEYIERAMKTADSLLKVYSLRGFKSIYRQEEGFLPARFDKNWKSQDKFSCLVGNAQISLVWSMLYQVTKDVKYLNAALKINRDLKSLQILDSSSSGIKGGIKGSHPIWGLYRSLGYPAWAAKFFIDALIAEEKALL